MVFVPTRKLPQEPQDARPTDPGFVPQTKSLFEKFRDLARTSADRIFIQPVVRVAEVIFQDADRSTFARTRVQAVLQERRKTKTLLTELSASGKTAAATSATIPTGDPSVFKIEPISDLAEFITDNVLNDYINLQYHLVLTMLPDRGLAELQRQIPQAVDEANLDDILSLNRRIGAVTLASTGTPLPMCQRLKTSTRAERSLL